MALDAGVIVVGAGAIGLSTAYHLAREGEDVLVLEKEAEVGLHQSGRNSGVAHSAHNALPGSAKARYCLEGNRRLRAWCAEHGLAWGPTGMLVVAQDEAQRGVLQELRRRGNANGARVRITDSEGIRSLEPAAAGIEALVAEDAASFDARAYVASLASEAAKAGARLRLGVQVQRLDDARDPGDAPAPAHATVHTTAGPLTCRIVVNAAGLFADRLAARLCPDMRIVPFRGFYAEAATGRRDLVRSHIYAAPDLAFPFLGVHLSRRSDGRLLVGPGAMLAFGREAYRLRDVSPRDVASMLAYPGFWRMAGRREVRSLVARELAKSLRLKAIWKEAHALVPALRPGDLVRSFAGNRAQMVARDGRFVDDIVVRRTATAVHVLNAVSPGLTCSLPFGEDLARVARS